MPLSKYQAVSLPHSPRPALFLPFPEVLSHRAQGNVGIQPLVAGGAAHCLEEPNSLFLLGWATGRTVRWVPERRAREY